MKEQYPLQWPGNRPRTRINDRVARGAWKLTNLQYIQRRAARSFCSCLLHAPSGRG
jgi:hypothetical protein